MEQIMIKLGIIGMSEGNGHPYSWAAIINGYDKYIMAECPFPAIPDYLNKEKYPDNFIKGAQVTHIWTQDKATSEHVSKASKIENIVDTPEDMIGEVDAILLARDDYQNHLKFATPFLEADIPVYIDKPLANSLKNAEALLELSKHEAQIYTCSALRYSRELEHLQNKKSGIQSISAHTPKSWSLYSIHIIEPVVAILGSAENMSVEEKNIDGEAVELSINYGGKLLQFKSAGTAQGTINFSVNYQDGTTENIVIADMFYAFRSALEKFLEQIKNDSCSISRQETLSCMKIIELGKAE